MLKLPLTLPLVLRRLCRKFPARTRTNFTAILMLVILGVSFTPLGAVIALPASASHLCLAHNSGRTAAFTTPHTDTRQTDLMLLSQSLQRFMLKTGSVFQISLTLADRKAPVSPPLRFSYWRYRIDKPPSPAV